jgi:ABC-2 type transport system permease protein
MWSICKKEFGQFFSNLTGYLTIFLFLLVNGLFLFFFEDSNLFDRGFANLDSFFELAPWVLLFLIPAISMRSFSDEYKNGTFEWLKTKPLSMTQIVLGKYFAILFIVLVITLPTLTYVYTIQTLSAQTGIDVGGILGSYFGLILLSATYAAIGVCCSSHTPHAVVAFLLSAFVCLFMYEGFHAFSKMEAFRGGLDYYFDLLGIDAHYRSISRGVLDSRDLIYFLSLILLALFITRQKIQHRQS